MQIRSTIFDLTPAEQIKMLGTKQVDRLYRTPRRTASWLVTRSEDLRLPKRYEIADLNSPIRGDCF